MLPEQKPPAPGLAESRVLGPGGAVPSEGLHHSGVPLCLENEVAHPFVNAAEVPCHTDDAWPVVVFLWW
jgi:hypothetical protein